MRRRDDVARPAAGRERDERHEAMVGDGDRPVRRRVRVEQRVEVVADVLLARDGLGRAVQAPRLRRREHREGHEQRHARRTPRSEQPAAAQHGADRGDDERVAGGDRQPGRGEDGERDDGERPGAEREPQRARAPAAPQPRQPDDGGGEPGLAQDLADAPRERPGTCSMPVTRPSVSVFSRVCRSERSGSPVASRSCPAHSSGPAAASATSAARSGRPTQT